MAKKNSPGEINSYHENQARVYALLRKAFNTSYTIILAHMPKAAGISLNTIMKKQYGSKRVLEVDPIKPRKAYLDVMNLPVWSSLSLRAISGHVIWGMHEWLPKPSIYITVLRDPVERVLSFYSYILSSPTHHLHNEMMDKNMGLEEFLQWDKSVFEVSNLQCKLLSSMYPFRETHIPTVFERAKHNLENHFLVGLTEEFEKSLELFSKSFGWHNAKIERENITPNRIKRNDISPQAIQKIESLNEYDIELYKIGQQLFTSQLDNPQAAFAKKIGR